MTTSPELVSITACVEHFAARGRVVDRSTISRFVKKHGLGEGHGKMNAVLVNPDRVWKIYTADFQRATMSGEASGLVAPRVTATPQPSAPPAAQEQALPRADEGAAGGASGSNVEPIKSPAVLEKEQKVRQLTRENDEAEGKLVPAFEVSAAMAAAVAEQRTVWKRRQREFVEKAAAEFNLDTAGAVKLKAMLQGFLAAGQNAFSTELLELLTAREEDHAQVARDFEALTDMAAGQSEARQHERQPDAA